MFICEAVLVLRNDSLFVIIKDTMSLSSSFGVLTTKAFLRRCCKCGSSSSERNFVLAGFRYTTVRRYSNKPGGMYGYFKDPHGCSRKFPIVSLPAQRIFILRARFLSTTSAVLDQSQVQ